MIKNINEKNSLLVIIDIQESFRNIMKNYKDILIRTKILSKSFDLFNIPVIITEQYPKGLGKTAQEVDNENYKHFEKTKFSIFTDEMKNYLKEKNKENIIIVGMETHVCVYQSTRDLLNEGYNVTLIEDALGSRHKTNHKNALRQMSKWGANINNTESILFSLLADAKHPNFKEISKMVKEL